MTQNKHEIVCAAPVFIFVFVRISGISCAGSTPPALSSMELATEGGKSPIT